MKRLILMRHAKSDWSGTGDDHARTLNPRGIKSARVMGAWLEDQGWGPDEVLCSTATRTRQTLDLLSLPDCPARFERALYLAEAEEMIAVLKTAELETVLVLGHNHGIAECAHRLVKSRPDHPRFAAYPTCATTLMTFDIECWSALVSGTGSCAGFAVPRDIMDEGVPGA
ncbi:SixA phosphatase family protein [Marivita sp. S2033]|uniref:SixA phosphatase family protein n=1 Tax=Marivita sp. S2033 TaxID=3373187 RepID=UPI003981B725